MGKVHKTIAELPTTNARISVTLIIWFVTAARYWFGGWEPSWEFLTTITVMSGLDAVQFRTKRQTAWKPEERRGHSYEGENEQV